MAKSSTKKPPSGERAIIVQHEMRCSDIQNEYNEQVRSLIAHGKLTKDLNAVAPFSKQLRILNQLEKKVNKLLHNV